MYEMLDNMSLYDLGELVKETLARIHDKLQEEEGFNYYQKCMVLSYGPNDYNNQLMIVEDISRGGGLDWPKTWFI